MQTETFAFEAPPSVNTPTSPNTNVVTTPSFDTNNTTQLSFQFQGRIPVWTPSVSQAAQSVTLAEDRVIGTTRWLKGMTVTYRILDATQYSVVLDGQIEDGGALYSLVGTTLGIFKRVDVGQTPPTAKLAAEELPTARFDAPPSQNTPTSPNTNVVTTPTFDTNNTTNMSFQFQGRIPVWTPSVSQAAQSIKLVGNRTIGTTVWVEGMTVTYRILTATTYTVVLDGMILDGGSAYSLAGTTLGIFTRSDNGKAGP